MVRTNTASHSKALQDAPRPGTKIRDAYDRLRRGETIRGADYGHAAIERLRTDYMMEIDAFSGIGGGLTLKGEWDGDRFIPLADIISNG